MNKFFFALVLCGHTLVSFAQAGSMDVNHKLMKIYRVNEKFKNYSYSVYRDIRYHDDNYSHQSKMDVYIEKNSKILNGYRWQGLSNRFLDIFNGKLLYSIDKQSLEYSKDTINSERKLASSAFVNNSLEMVNAFIPKLIKMDSIHYAVGDTTMEGQSFSYISFSKPFHFYNGNVGLDKHTVPGLAHIHYLLYNKKTWQIEGYIMHYIRTTQSKDFAKFLYKNFTPKKQKLESWSSDVIEKKYHLKSPKPVIPMVKINQKIPDFVLPVYKASLSDTLASSDLKDKIVLIEFWFKACGPCMEAMPHLNEIQAKFSNDSFQLVSINVEDPIDDIKFFNKKYTPPFPMLYNGKKYFQSLGFNGCPTSLLVDKSGVIREVFHGFNKSKVENSIAKIIDSYR